MSHSISQSNEKSLVQFDYEKAVSNYLGTQSTFKTLIDLICTNSGKLETRIYLSISLGLTLNAYRSFNLYIYLYRYIYISRSRSIHVYCYFTYRYIHLF